MLLDPATLDQIDRHAPFVVFLAFTAVFAIVLTISAIVDARRRREHRRAAERRTAADRAAGIQHGIDRGWHDAPGTRTWKR
jgi:hypothetical protein